MNPARDSTLLLLALIAVLGMRHYRAVINPVSCVALPMAGALGLEEAGLGSAAPFGLAAGLYIAGAVTMFLIGAILRPVPAITPGSLEFNLSRRRQRMLTVSLFALVVLLYVGAEYVARVYAAVGATIASSVFDRGLVSAAVQGTDAAVVRAVQAFSIFLAVPIALFWLTKHRWRWPLSALYVFALIDLGSALRARLGVILALLLWGIVILLGRSWQAARSHPVLIAFGAVVLLGGVYFAFDAIYEVRHGFGPSTATTLYSFVGGPSAFSEVVSGEQSVYIYGGRGVSVEGLLSFAGRERTLGNYSSVALSGSLVNIYTGVGVLDFDVGLVPTLVVFLLLGVAAQAIWLRVRRRPTAGSVAVLAVFALLWVSLPVTLLTQYNFWWAALLSPLIVNRMFPVHDSKVLAMPATLLSGRPGVVLAPRAEHG